MRAAVIDDMGKVINIILVNDLSFSPGDGLTLVESETANIGDTYNDGAFIPAPVSLPVPQEITMRQARLVLLGAGLLHQVDAALNALPSPMKEAAFIEWEYSSTVKRSSALVVQLGQSFGLTADQIDAMFRQGATL